MNNILSSNTESINLIKLISSLSQTAPHILKLTRDWDVIARRYGLQGGKVYTLQDIGDYYDISRERVRQIEAKATNRIHAAIISDSTLPTELGTAQERKNELAQVHKGINSFGQVISIDEVNEYFEQRYSTKLTPHDLGAIRLLLAMLEFNESPEKIKDSSVALKTSWVKSNFPNISALHQTARAIHAVLSETGIALPLFDLKIAIVKKLKQKIDNSLITNAIKICDEIERKQPDLFQLRFEHLHSLADKAYRILFDNNGPLHISEIKTEISHRLAVIGQHEKIPSRSIQQQLVSDLRFLPIGRSGKWVLAGWKGYSKDSILSLIEEFFNLRKTAVTLNEVFEYVVSKRPDASINSIKIYLSNGNLKENRFIKVSKDKYELSEWGGQAIPTKIIRKKIVRKVPTLEQTIQEEISSYLTSRPNQESLVNTLAEHVMQCTKCKRPTFYAYLAKMKNVVKYNDNKNLRCRLTQDQATRSDHLQFTQIKNINDQVLRGNLERAIKNLNLEHVDLGLFSLGRIFEAELRSFLEVAREKKIYTVTAADLEKLASMIDCLERNKVINEKHVLTFLRQDRNERAHGRIPSTEERERLLQDAPHSAGLFIQYIAMLNKKKLELT
ncbi:MAG: sigma factor-like helix-turn-helix DNA-binding protein [Gallionella sp.]